jgi:hypothetical protein
MVPVLLAVAALMAHGSASAPTIPDCYTQVVSPARITLACADGNFLVAGLRWRGWGGATATATGTSHQNDCTPNCAAGHFQNNAVSVTAIKLATCLGGRRQYTRLVWRFTLGRARGSTDFPCGWPLHPQLSAKRSGGTIALYGAAWTRGGGCRASVAITSGATKVATATVPKSGAFKVLWKQPQGRHVVVARQTCRGGRLFEAVVSVR